MSDKAVVLLSGGMDSGVCLALARLQHTEVKCVSFYYGQTHSLAESQAAQRLVEYYDVPLKYISLPTEMFTGTGSVIVAANRLDQLKMTYEEIQASYGVSPTYVPFRNGLLLSAASVFALKEEAEYLYAGMHSEDARNWAYPDCTPEFLGAMANAIYVGTYHKVRLLTPLQWMTKGEIVSIGLKLELPFKYTYSCYAGGEKQCGTCPTCVGRIHAFRVNEAIDPAPYAIEIDWHNNMEGVGV
jgi:7-cyano-7-deazaguanine synthase